MKETARVKEIVLTVEEYEQLKQVLLELIDVKEFAKRITERIVEMLTENPEEFADGFEDGEIEINEYEVVEKLFPMLLESEWEYNYSLPVPTIIYEEVYQLLDMKRISKTAEKEERELKQLYKEYESYERNPLAYHGLRQKDFL